MIFSDIRSQICLTKSAGWSIETMFSKDSSRRVKIFTQPTTFLSGVLPRSSEFVYGRSIHLSYDQIQKPAKNIKAGSFEIFIYKVYYIQFVHNNL